MLFIGLQVFEWLDSTDLTTDLARPEITDATVLGASHVLSAVMPTVYLAADDAALAWLSLKALQVWSDHGPAPALLHPVSLIGFPAISVPCGVDHDGLPIGLQLVAPPHHEAVLVAAARAYESLR